MRPFVSVGIPVRNGGAFLSQALDSVLQQTFHNLEVIIIDNGSEDDTAQIARRYAAQDTRVRFYQNNTNIGAAANFNSTFYRSRGQYFKWVAADDVLEPAFIERCLIVLQRNQNYVLACSRAMIFHDRTKKIQPGTHDYDRADLSNLDPCERLRHLFQYSAVYPIFGLIRSSVLRGTVLMRPHVGADFCLLVDLLLRGPFGEVPEPLMKLRAHSQGYSCSVARLRQEGYIENYKQAAWWNPFRRRKRIMPYAHRLREHGLSVLRSNAGLWEKAGMLLLLCRVANWWRSELRQEAMQWF